MSAGRGPDVSVDSILARRLHRPDRGTAGVDLCLVHCVSTVDRNRHISEFTVTGPTAVANIYIRIFDWAQSPLDRSPRGLRDKLSALVTAPTTWTSLVLVLLKFVYGTVAFTALVTAGATVIALLSAPFVYADPSVQYTVGPSTIETLPGAVAVAGTGLLAGLVALHLLNGLAIGGGLLTAALLELAPDHESNGGTAAVDGQGEAVATANGDDGVVNGDEDETDVDVNGNETDVTATGDADEND